MCEARKHRICEPDLILSTVIAWVARHNSWDICCALLLKMQTRQPQSEQHMLLIGCLVTLTRFINIKHKQSLDDWSWPFCGNIWWCCPRYFFILLPPRCFISWYSVLAGRQDIRECPCDLGRNMVDFFPVPCKNRWW